MPEPEPQWLILLRELICRIYKEWGGDCNNLPQGIPGQIKTLVDTYAAQGPPDLPSESAVTAYLALLDETEAHLNLPQNTLAAEDDAALRQLIADLRNDLGA
jgi:hypothetical protein